MSCFAPNEADMARGAYVFRDAHMGLCDGIVAFDEPGELLRAAALLSVQGIALRLVRVTDPEVFGRQGEEYRKRVFKPGLPVIAVTDGGWPGRIGAACILPPMEAEALSRELKRAVTAGFR